MKNLITAFLAVSAYLIFAGNACADKFVWRTDGAVWSDPTAWVDAYGAPLNSIPGPADTAYIRYGHTAIVDSDVGQIATLYIGDLEFWGSVGILNIVPGGMLNFSGNCQIGRAIAGAYGELNISGGVFQAGDPRSDNGPGSLSVAIGIDALSAHTTGILTVSGAGTFIGRAIVGSSVAGDSGDKFRIVGSKATVFCPSTYGSYNLEVRASGTVEWVFDSEGVATMTCADPVSFAAGSAIVVDGAAYQGGNETFTLLTSPVLRSTPPSITLTNFAPGTTYNWDSTSTNMFTVSVIGFTPSILTVNNGSGSGTYDRQQQVIITANTPAAGKIFDVWTGATQYVASGTSSTTMVTMPTSNITVTASYKDIYCTLIVKSVCGVPVPHIGTNIYVWGTVLAASVDSSVTSGQTNWTSAGWIGSGSVPASGVSTNTGGIILTGLVSSIVWNWNTNYWLEVATSGSGSVNPASGWCPAGENLSMTAVPSNGWLFMGWSGDATNDYDEESIIVPMVRPISVTAAFSDDADGDGLLNTNETALGTDPRNKDSDEDGMNDAQELIAGTSPTNQSSVLDVQLSLSGSTNEVSWYGVSGRYYQLEYTDSLTNGWTPKGSISSGTNSQITKLDISIDTGRFYRIRVSDSPGGF